MKMIPATRFATCRALKAIAVSAAFAALFLYFANLGKFSESLRMVHLGDLAVVTGLSVIMAVLRAVRIAVATGELTSPAVFRASFLHGAANALLPARIGEAVLPITLARSGVVDPVTGTGLLILVRLCDFAALLGAGLILLVATDQQILPAFVEGAALLAGSALLGGILILPSALGWLCSRVPGSLRDASQRLAGAAIRLGWASRFALLILTVGIWLSLGLAAQVAVAAVDVEAALAPVWLACTAASLAFATPANGFASFGPFEAAFVAVLVSFGHPAAASLVAALSLHASAIVAASAMAALAAFLPGQISGRMRVVDIGN